MKKIISIYLGIILLFPLLAFNVSANEPPSLPNISGPTRAKEGEVLAYSFVSIDPEGDDISYCIQWGDDAPEICIGPYTSGKEQSNSHSYFEGTYIIKIKARDINGAESNWESLELSVPKNKIISSFFFKFLENQPTLYQLFEKIFGL